MTTVKQLFRFHNELGYNVCQLTFSLPKENSLGYQYVYTSFRYRTLLDSAPMDLSKKTHISIWMRCIGCSSNVRILPRLYPYARDYPSLPISSIVVGPDWTNFKISFSQEAMENVDYLTIVIQHGSLAASKGVLEMALITASDGTPQSQMPVSPCIV